MYLFMGLVYALMFLALAWVIYLWIDDAEKAREEDRAIRAQRYYAQYGQGVVSLHFIRPRRSIIHSIINKAKEYINA